MSVICQCVRAWSHIYGSDFWQQTIYQTNPHEISSNDSLVFPRYKLIRLDTTLNAVKVS